MLTPFMMNALLNAPFKILILLIIVILSLIMDYFSIKANSQLFIVLIPDYLYESHQ